ncbi:hypothetical protein [Nocardioides cynanchi]|uniref:hypothetical protein n=1 Tax=Nocardioides cynanchi TaxID=2558918 RepID=UPI0012475FF9|nr:hypothetical protein [Nocardioides cynanchi]
MNPEDLLTETLHDRVERTDYPSTPLSAVAGRAGAIRARRRRTTVLAAAAAVAVVVVPGAVWLGRSPGSSPQPSQSLSSGPSTDPTAPTLAEPLPLSALPLGQKPGIDYLVGDTYVTMSGDRITDAVFGNATTATPVRDGILASVPPAPGLMAQDGIAGTYLVSDAHHQYLGCGSDRFAMSTDGVQSAYWLADSCPVADTVAGALYSGVDNTMGESGPGRVVTPVGTQVTPVGIVQQGVVTDVVHGPAESVQVVDSSGHRSPVTGLARAGGSDENHDVLSGQLASDVNTGAIVDAATGAVQVRVPGWTLGQFSSDGRYVLGDQPRNGPTSDAIAVFDARTGHKVADLNRPGGPGVTLGQPAWDVDDTVLAVADSTEGSTIVRFDLQGHVTRATSVSHASGAYRLATRP